jgi:hypothetical protein
LSQAHFLPLVFEREVVFKIAVNGTISRVAGPLCPGLFIAHNGKEANGKKAPGFYNGKDTTLIP